MKPFFLVLVLLALIPALALDPNRSLHHYVKRNWSINDGLPQNSVQAIAQTPDGFIWAGTQDGLVRFDGFTFDVFTTASHASLTCDYITALAVDAKGDLWVGAEHGLFRFDDGTFEGFHNSALGNDFIQDLEVDSQGNLWISSHGNGLFRFREGLFETIEPATLRTDSGGFYDLDYGQDGLWIAHREGLFLYKDGQLKRFGLAEGYTFGTPYTLCQSFDGKVWISTQQGLVTYQNERFEVFAGNDQLSDDLIYSLYEDRQGMLWVGTYKALNRIYHGKVEIEAVQNEAFSVDAVSSIMEDREGNLWFGRDHTGLFILKNARFQTFTKADGLPADMVNAVFQMRDGSIFAATNDGLAKFEKERFVVVPAESQNLSVPLIALEEGLAGELWAGYEDGSLRIFKNGTVRVLETRDAHFHGRPIFVIKNDGQGRMWVGSTKSLGLMNEESGNLISSMDFEKDIHCFLPKQDRIWLGVNGGLGYFMNYALDAYVDLDDIFSPTVVFLQEDDRDGLWAATYGSGLWYRQGDTWTNITRTHGLFDDKIFSMVPDGNGYYWFSSNRGISKVAKRALYAVVDGNEATFESRVFGLDDGIVSLECNGGSQPSAIRAQDGRLWFITTRGTTTVKPGFGLLDPVPPPVHVTEISADGRRLSPQPQINLPIDTQQLAIAYTALNYANPESIRFQYQLEPFDTAWRDVGTRRVAFYNHLPAGDYRFNLRAISKDGIEGTLGEPIEMVVTHVWWKRSALIFLIAMLILALVVVVGFFRFRYFHKKQKANQDVLNHYSRDLANLRPKLIDAEQRLLHLEHRLGLEDLGQQVLNTVSRMLGVVQREVATIERCIKAARGDESLIKPKKLFTTTTGDVGEVFDLNRRALIAGIQNYAENVAESESRLLREVVNLRDRIHQVSELIEAQQQYAKTSHGPDEVDVNALVEDAVRLLHDLPAKGDIQVIQDLLPTPAVRLPKSKLLQAISLLTREACLKLQAMQTEERRILMIVTKVDQNGNVQVRIDQRGGESVDVGELTMARRIHFVQKLIADMGCSFETQQHGLQWCCTINIPAELVVQKDRAVVGD